MSNKKKVWKDVDEVIKPTEIPKKLIVYSSIMEDIPKGEKSKQ